MITNSGVIMGGVAVKEGERAHHGVLLDVEHSNFFLRHKNSIILCCGL